MRERDLHENDFLMFELGAQKCEQCENKSMR